MLSPILHPASGLWLLGRIENHTAKPMSREEIESHIAEHNRLRTALAEAEKHNREINEQPAALPGRIADEIARRSNNSSEPQAR